MKKETCTSFSRAPNLKTNKNYELHNYEPKCYFIKKWNLYILFILNAGVCIKALDGSWKKKKAQERSSDSDISSGCSKWFLWRKKKPCLKLGFSSIYLEYYFTPSQIYSHFLICWWTGISLSDCRKCFEIMGFLLRRKMIQGKAIIIPPYFFSLFFVSK